MSWVTRIRDKSWKALSRTRLWGRDIILGQSLVRLLIPESDVAEMPPGITSVLISWNKKNLKDRFDTKLCSHLQCGVCYILTCGSKSCAERSELLSDMWLEQTVTGYWGFCRVWRCGRRLKQEIRWWSWREAGEKCGFRRKTWSWQWFWGTAGGQGGLTRRAEKSCRLGRELWFSLCRFCWSLVDCCGFWWSLLEPGCGSLLTYSGFLCWAADIVQPDTVLTESSTIGSRWWFYHE